ncbi:MAG TPA: EcsC family protein [Euzebyales bacterium]|nr:EcsC family protein [Euzebyales bacterium]
MPGITDRIAESFVAQLARGGLDGVGPLAPARQVAEEALAAHGTPEAAIDEIIADHTRLAAVSGFVTSLGGFIVLPVAVPANLLGFYTLATRMVAALAHVRGHDVARPETRIAVLTALTGDDIGTVLSHAGMVLPAGGVTMAWLRKIAPSVTTMVNKAIGFRLLVGTGERALVRFGRAIPLAGGVIGGTIDVALIRSIARHARRAFPATPKPDAEVTPVSTPSG